MSISRYLSLFSNFLSSTGVLGVSGGGTNLSSYTTGDTLYASATNTLSNRAIGSTNQVLLISGGVPVWGALPSSATLTTYTSGSGNWSKPSAGTFVLVRMWGGGGSGQKRVLGNSTNGGGGGAYAERFYLLSNLGTTEAYSVGAGGAAVSGTNTAGNAGNSSTFSSGSNLLTAYGGGLAINTQAGLTGELFATGGSGTGIAATQFWQGGGGGNGAQAGYAGYMGGGGGGGTSTTTAQAGGTSVGGGAGGASAASASATAGSAPGGGGGSCISNTAGDTSGKGGDGRIEIWVW